MGSISTGLRDHLGTPSAVVFCLNNFKMDDIFATTNLLVYSTASVIFFVSIFLIYRINIGVIGFYSPFPSRPGS